MTITEYRIALANHDWYYYFSDDHGVWSRGDATSKDLFNIAKSGGAEFQAAYNEQHAKHFNTESFYPKSGNNKYTPPFEVSS